MSIISQRSLIRCLCVLIAFHRVLITSERIVNTSFVDNMPYRGDIKPARVDTNPEFVGSKPMRDVTPLYAASEAVMMGNCSVG